MPCYRYLWCVSTLLKKPHEIGLFCAVIVRLESVAMIGFSEYRCKNKALFSPYLFSIVLSRIFPQKFFRPC